MKRQSLVLSAVVVCLLLIIVTTVSYVIGYHDNSIKRDRFFETEHILSESVGNGVNSSISLMLNDLNFIERTVVDHIDASTLRTELATTWLEFSDEKKIYDQIRYIDNRGREVLRVNFNDKGSVIVPEAELQDKRQRYYFGEAKKLKKNIALISKLDLNVEHGSVEKPIRPMLRIAKPIYDNDTFDGVIIINYNASFLIDMIDKLLESSRADDVYLLNSDGYRLYAKVDKTQTWSFMYPDRQDQTLAKQQPELWQRILTADLPYIRTDNGYYAASVVQPIDRSTNGHFLTPSDYVMLDASWYLVSHIRLDNDYFKSWDNIGNYVVYSVRERGLTVAAIGMAAVVLCLLLYQYFNSAIMRENKRTFDLMTGAYNRYTGITVIEQLYRVNRALKQPFGIIYFDLNKLKKINDQFGHDIGDRAIQSFGVALSSSFRWHKRVYVAALLHNLAARYWPKLSFSRKDDVFVRLGGDEFLIGCSNTTQEQIENICQRVNASIADIELNGIDFSASYGYVVINKDDDLSLDDMINLADKMMYEHKYNARTLHHIIESAKPSSVPGYDSLKIVDQDIFDQFFESFLDTHGAKISAMIEPNYVGYNDQGPGNSKVIEFEYKLMGRYAKIYILGRHKYRRSLT